MSNKVVGEAMDLLGLNKIAKASEKKTHVHIPSGIGLT